MAYVPKDDEEQQAQASSGQPGLVGGGRQGVGPSRSKFVNVSEYLTKNPNEGENIVNRATSNLESQRNDASSSVDAADTEFGSRVNSATTNLDNDFLSGALSSPETFVQNPDNVARFSALKNAAYNGPNSLQETDIFAPAQSKVDSLKQTGASIGTEAGRNAIIAPLSPRPTQGKTALNQMIMQGQPGAAQKLQDVAGTFSSVDDKWNQLLAKSPSMVEGAKAATDTARTTTNQRLGDTVNAFKTGVNQKVDTATNERGAFNSQLEGILRELYTGGAGLTQKQLDSLGASDAYPYLSKMNSFNQELKNYGSPVQLSNWTSGGAPNSNIPTVESVADSSDYAREAALQQLSGSDLGLPDQMGTPYKSNGGMPNIDYKGAFGAAGTGLSEADKQFLAARGVDVNKAIAEKQLYGYTPIAGMDAGQDAIRAQTALGRLTTPDFYTSTAANATAPEGSAYPYPTSPQPGPGFVWNTAGGFWQDMGNAPPNLGGGGGSGGGGGNTFIPPPR